MAYILLFLVAIALPAQTVVSAFPSGNNYLPSSGCPECNVLTQLDGYALEPLVRIRFSAPVDPNAMRARVAIVWGATRQADGFTTYPDGYRMPINNVSWDPATNTLYGKPDEPLDHDREYALVVDGNEVSRFRTRHVTRAILARRPGPTGSLRRSLGQTIDLANVKSLQVLSQVSADANAPLVDTGFPVDIAFLTQLGLRRLMFFNFESSRGDRVAVHAWIPNGAKPVGGWPVKLIGHGLFDSRFSGPTLFASSFIGNSVVMAIDAVGHGYGPRSILRFVTNDGATIDAPTEGRGTDENRDGVISPGEGCIRFSSAPDYISRCLVETALDYQKLVREIQANVDLDGDREGDLNPNSIQYLGQSLGSMYGTILTAIEPGVDAAVLNVGGGSASETARTSDLIRELFTQYIAAAYPDLVGVMDPLTPRYAPVQTISTKQAQYLEFLDRVATLEVTASPASFAPFLKQATLYGNPIKRVLFQYALGDRSVPNNANGQLIRAAFEYELVSLYRHDLARRVFPSLPENPHTYLAAFATLDQPSLVIALATLTQASEFLASGRREVPNVNALVRLFFGQNLFETPSLIP